MTARSYITDTSHAAMYRALTRKLHFILLYFALFTVPEITLNYFIFEFYVAADHLNTAVTIVLIASSISSSSFISNPTLLSIVGLVSIKNIRLELVVHYFYYIVKACLHNAVSLHTANTPIRRNEKFSNETCLIVTQSTSRFKA